MSIRLRVEAGDGSVPIAGEVVLPCAGKTFTMTALGARQLGEHLIRLSDLVDAAEMLVE